MKTVILAVLLMGSMQANAAYPWLDWVTPFTPWVAETHVYSEGEVWNPDTAPQGDTLAGGNIWTGGCIDNFVRSLARRGGFSRV